MNLFSRTGGLKNDETAAAIGHIQQTIDQRDILHGFACPRMRNKPGICRALEIQHLVDQNPQMADRGDVHNPGFKIWFGNEADIILDLLFHSLNLMRSTTPKSLSVFLMQNKVN